MPHGTPDTTGTTEEKKTETGGGEVKPSEEKPEGKKETGDQEPKNIPVPKPPQTSPSQTSSPPPQSPQPTQSPSPTQPKDATTASSPSAPKSPEKEDGKKKQAREELQRALEKLEAQRKAIEEQMQALLEQQTDLEEERTDVPKERAGITEQSQQAEQEREALDSQKRDLEQREANLNDAQKRLDAEREALDEAKRRLTANKTALFVEKHMLQTDRDALERDRADIPNQIATGVRNQIAADQANQAQADLTNLVRELSDPISRSRVLKSKFVDEYRGQKEQERKELERALSGAAAPAAPGGQPNLANVPIPPAGMPIVPQQKHWYDDITAEAVNDKFAEYSSIGNYANAGWSAVDGFLDSDSKTKDGMTQIDRYANNGLAAGNALLSGGQNISQFVVNRKKRNATKDKAKKANLTWNTVGNAFSLTGNVTKLTGSVIGLSTDLKGRQDHLDNWKEKHKNDNAQMDDYTKQSRDVLRTSDWMSGLTTGFSLAGTVAKYGGNIREGALNRKIAKDLDTARIKDDAINSLETAKKGRLDNALQAAGYDKADAAYRTELDEYKAFKAKKYTMEQMKQFRENKGNRLSKGLFGTLASAGSAVSSFASIFDKGYKSAGWGKKLRGFIPAINIAANKLDNFIGSKTDKHIAEGKERIKIGEIDKYLDKKRVKVQKDVDDKLNMGVNHFQMSNDEIDRITLGRLGVDIPVTNDPLTKEDKLKAFEQLNLKRAKQITDISDATKRGNILEAMGIDADANLEEIAAALKGE